MHLTNNSHEQTYKTNTCFWLYAHIYKQIYLFYVIYEQIYISDVNYENYEQIKNCFAFQISKTYTFLT